MAALFPLSLLVRHREPLALGVEHPRLMRVSISSARRVGLLAPLALLFAVAASGCDSGDDTDPSAADPTGRANDSMLVVLESFAALNPQPLPTLTPVQARQQPTIADAVRRRLTETGRSTAPEPVGSTVDRTINVPGVPALPVRVYTPSGAAPTGGWPVVVYYHGGGWVVATIDTYDASARSLTNAARAIVISVEYRKAPENKFPAAHDDAYAAYVWAVQNAASIGGNPAKVAVAGESAGGNLAAATALAARDAGVQEPVHQLLVYPIAGYDFETESYRENADAKPLDRPTMQWFFGHYLRTAADGQDPRINLVERDDLAGAAPATVITAEIDPLRSEGQEYADDLEDAGVDVEHYYFDGVTHEFFGTGAVVPEGLTAVQQAGVRLRAAFGS